MGLVLRWCDWSRGAARVAWGGGGGEGERGEERRDGGPIKIVTAYGQCEGIKEEQVFIKLLDGERNRWNSHDTCFLITCMREEG